MKTFVEWLEKNGLAEANAKFYKTKTHVGTGVEIDESGPTKLAFIETEDGRRLGPITNIKEMRVDDPDRPGNRLYKISIGIGRLHQEEDVSLDEPTMRKVLSIFNSPVVAAQAFQKLAAQQGRIGGSNKPGSAKIIM